MFLLALLLIFGLVRGIIGTYFNWQIRKIVNTDAKEKGLEVISSSKTSWAENKWSAFNREKEYFKTVDCLDVEIGQRYRFHVKIVIDPKGQATLDWKEMS